MVCLKLRRGDHKQIDQGPTGRAGWVLFPLSRLRGHMTATCFVARPALDDALNGALNDVLVEALVEGEPS
jgi:hypothetical protein